MPSLDYPGYELTMITRVEMTEPAYKKLTDKVEAVVKSFDGEVVQTDDWGRRKLAYPIQKQSRARYTYYAFTAKPGVVQEIERNLKITEGVLRYLTVQIEKHFNKEEFLKNYQPVSADRALEKATREFRDYREPRESRDYRDRDSRDSRDYRN